MSEVNLCSRFYITNDVIFGHIVTFSSPVYLTTDTGQTRKGSLSEENDADRLYPEQPVQHFAR